MALHLRVRSRLFIAQLYSDWTSRTWSWRQPRCHLSTHDEYRRCRYPAASLVAIAVLTCRRPACRSHRRRLADRPHSRQPVSVNVFSDTVGAVTIAAKARRPTRILNYSACIFNYESNK